MVLVGEEGIGIELCEFYCDLRRILEERKC